jgi:hypothetical protein
MIKSEKIYTPQTYLELVTGRCYTASSDNDIAYIESILEDHDLCLWNYPLNEIDYIVKENLDVVLVDCLVYNKDTYEYEHVYRWFEVSDCSAEEDCESSNETDSEKKVSAESIAINAIEHSIFCDSEILTEYYGNADEYFGKNFGCTVDEAEKALGCKFGIRDRWPEESIWAEIVDEHFDEDERKLYIDAWISDDDWEEGTVIAKVNTDGTVEYIDERAKTDPYAQSVIAHAIASVKKFFFS